MDKNYLNPDKVFLALYSGRSDQLEVAIRRGFDVATTNDDGQTLLQEAAFIGAANAVSALIKAGAPVDGRNPDGDTPLLLAIASKGIAASSHPEHADLASLPLVERVRWAAASGDSLKTVETLLDAGADPNGRGSGGWTPLLLAIQEGRTDVVRMLVERGADPTLHTEDRVTPIALAQRYRRRHPEIVALIQGKLPSQMGLDFAQNIAQESPEPARRSRPTP